MGDEDVILQSRDLKSLGPEPLEKDFNEVIFKKIVKSSRGKAKQFLLDQNKIAGIGNIYADEILWRVKIHPLRRVETLKDSEIKRLFEFIKRVLTEAVRYRGTSKTDYRDAYGKKGSYVERLMVYGRRGKKCSRCGNKIERMTIGTRSASFCSKCQA